MPSKHYSPKYLWTNRNKLNIFLLAKRYRYFCEMLVRPTFHVYIHVLHLSFLYFFFSMLLTYANVTPCNKRICLNSGFFPMFSFLSMLKILINKQDIILWLCFCQILLLKLILWMRNFYSNVWQMSDLAYHKLEDWAGVAQCLLSSMHKNWSFSIE